MGTGSAPIEFRWLLDRPVKPGDDSMRVSECRPTRSEPYTTPSFFCRLVDEVVYWNTRRLSGKT